MHRCVCVCVDVCFCVYTEDKMLLHYESVIVLSYELYHVSYPVQYSLFKSLFSPEHNLNQYPNMSSSSDHRRANENGVHSDWRFRETETVLEYRF